MSPHGRRLNTVPLVGSLGRCARRISEPIERGQAALSLILVIAVIAVAVGLLYRTAWTADSIDAKAERIATSGSGVNTSTAAVLKLGRTNQLAGSILESARPLEGQLGEILRLARSIDATATSINSTAGDINGTAKGINGSAATILGSARSINDGVAQINANLDTTIEIARAIKADTANILTQADAANHFASCIDRGLLSSTDNSTC